MLCIKAPLPGIYLTITAGRGIFLPAKVVPWTSRRRRRRPLAWKSYLYCLLLVAAMALALRLAPAGQGGAESPPASTAGLSGSPPDHALAGDEPAAAAPSGEKGQPESETPAAAPPQDSSLLRLLQAMIAANVPGLEPPPVAEGEVIRNAVLDLFHTLTGVDWRDPRSILAAGLGADPLMALPEPHRPGPPVETAEPEQPPPDDPGRADQPVFAPVFPLPGYSEAAVLLYHTHISESFSEVRFTDNLDHTVARLGVELVRLLEKEYGIPVWHDQGVYDQPRTTAYEKARPLIGGIIEKNPQLKMVIDLHRDGVARNVTTADFQGSPIAKFLLVVGTGHPDWHENYRIALRLHRELEAVAPGLSRGVRMQDFVYNQDLHPRSILVEVGGHENSLEEAMRAVPYLAEALARTFYIFFVQE
jgi:stage II sporulation protein P